jgi:glycerol kinase
MRYVLALDQGTTSSRAIIFDEQGRPVIACSQEFPQYFPQPGWVEHDPLEIWRSQLAVARQALRDARLSAEQIAAIGIANQRETTIVWERASGKPLCRAIVWQDRRTAGACEEIKARGLEPIVTEKTGLLLDPYFSATKLAWILDNIPGARSKAEAGALAFGTVDTWLLWHLTGGAVHVTDPTNASRTMLFNIETGDWDDELLEIFRIPRLVLPWIGRSCGVCGTTNAEILGLPIAVGGIAGDQQAALFGQSCHRAGMAKNTYGTGCFLLLHTGEAQVTSHARLLTTRAAQVSDPVFAIEGSVFTAGAAVQWLRDSLGLFASAHEIEPMAAGVPDSDGVFFVPAFSGLGAPYWDAHARGSIVGLTRGTTRAHIARATLDAIALQCADVLSTMQADAGVRLRELRVDGGASANNLLMQIQADLLGVPVARPTVIETTALGAAYLAGLATGVWSTLDQIAQHWRRDRLFEPTWSADRREALLHRWRQAVDHTRNWNPAEEDRKLRQYPGPRR